MTLRVHHEDCLEWRRIGDIPMGWMADHIDPTELDGRLSFHEAGSATTMQLMEMRLNPGTLIAPHAHDDDEIFYVAEGSLHWQDKAPGEGEARGEEKVLAAGGSIFIPAGTTYSFHTGDAPTRLLNFRARADHSFVPAAR